MFNCGFPNMPNEQIRFGKAICCLCPAIGSLLFVLLACTLGGSAHGVMACPGGGGGGGGGGGTPFVMGDTYVPRFWPPFLTLAGSSTIFLGCFFSSTNTKTIFWVQILEKFDLFGPKIPFFPRSFWVQFSVARGTPPAIFGPSTPPPPPPRVACPHVA